MKVVIQRVLNASVKVDGNITGKIKKGLLIFLGIESGDSDDMLKKYADKIVRMRIFEDDNGKTNRSLSDVNGELLIVSQFTLCADCSHGNRPSFIGAKEPLEAKRMYEKFIGIDFLVNVRYRLLNRIRKIYIRLQGTGSRSRTR